MCIVSTIHNSTNVNGVGQLASQPKGQSAHSILPLLLIGVVRRNSSVAPPDPAAPQPDVLRTGIVGVQRSMVR